MTLVTEHEQQQIHLTHRHKHISKKNRKNQKEFKCQKCSLEMDADLNASLNILAEGHSVIACGEKTLVFSKKQELVKRKPVSGIS